MRYEGKRNGLLDYFKSTDGMVRGQWMKEQEICKREDCIICSIYHTAFFCYVYFMSLFLSSGTLSLAGYAIRFRFCRGCQA